MKTTCLLLLFSISTYYSQALVQQDSVRIVAAKIPVGISYIGDYLGTKPGCEIFIENPLKLYEKHKKNKVILSNLYNQSNLGFYHHAEYNTAFFLTSGIGLRRQRQSGFFTGYQLSAGLMRTITPGSTYKVDDNDKVSRTSGGFFYGLTKLSFEVGSVFNIKATTLDAFFRLSGMAQFPYNSGVLFHVMAGIGVRYSINWTKQIKSYYRLK
jgi:hypothetical protein